MGYDISARARSPKLQAKMAQFMREHYRTWNAISGGDVGEHVPSTDVAGHNAIGFHYGAIMGWHREWIYAVTRWMALKVGIRRLRFSKELLDPPEVKVYTSFLLYDGYQSWPTIVVDSPEEAGRLPGTQHYHAYDQYGAHIIFENYVDSSSIVMGRDIDPKLVKAVMVEWGKLGQCPSEDPEREEWRKKQTKIALEVLRPHIEEQHGKIVNELKRLDAAWEAF